VQALDRTLVAPAGRCLLGLKKAERHQGRDPTANTGLAQAEIAMVGEHSSVEREGPS
jgi:hypothetical protein